MAEVICVGSAVLDQVYSVPSLAGGSETLFAQGYRLAGAGTAASAAVAIVRLGGSAPLWAQLGDDETGDLVAADLVRHGVDTSALRRITGAQSPLSSVLAAADGQRQVTRFTGIGLPADADWLPFGRIQDTGAVLADPVWPAGAQAALAAARDSRRPGVLAVGAVPAPLPSALAAAAGYLVFTADELQRFTGARDADTGLAAASAMTGALVGLTDGTDGFRWRAPHGEPQSLPPLDLAIVDPTGAWDTFCGAFTLAIGEEKQPATAAAFAITAARLTAAAAGGRRAIPDRRSVWQHLVATFPELADSHD